MCLGKDSGGRCLSENGHTYSSDELLPWCTFLGLANEFLTCVTIAVQFFHCAVSVPWLRSFIALLIYVVPTQRKQTLLLEDGAGHSLRRRYEPKCQWAFCQIDADSVESIQCVVVRKDGAR